MNKLYNNRVDQQFILNLFSSLNGQYDRYESISHLFVGEDHELIKMLAGEQELGLEDNVSHPLPTQKEAEGERYYHQRLADIMEIQCKLGRGFKLYGEMKEYLTKFYDSHPQIKEWYKAREELNNLKTRAEALGINAHATEQEFWEKNRDLWLSSKAAWETPYGENATRVNDKIRKVWSRIEEILKEKDKLKVSTEEWRKLFNMGKEDMMKWDTITGDVHWSIAHLTEAERWYNMGDIERSQWEYEAHKEMWGKANYSS